MTSNAHPLAPEVRSGQGTPGKVDLHTLRPRLDTHIVQGIGVALLLGVGLGILLPRGAMTAPQALLTMLACLATGVAAGYLGRSRWIILLSPLAYLIATDLTASITDDFFAGVTHLSSNSSPSVGEVVFFTVFGHLMTFWMDLLPLALGASVGAAIARRRPAGTVAKPGSRRWMYVRRGISGLLGAGLVAMAVWLFIPASTPPVVDAQGNAIPGSISELAQVTLGGHEQWIEVRGASEDLPVLLYLQADPGRTEMARSRVMLDDLTDEVIVVSWDQRGSGKSYTSIDPQTLTLESVVADTVELTNYLRERFGEEKIYLMGQGWGSTIAVLAASEHPDLYHAVITGNQIVDLGVGNQRAWENAIAWAEKNGTPDRANRLRELGPPPYDNLADYDFGDYGLEGPLPEPVTQQEITDEMREYQRRDNAVSGGFLSLGGSEFTLMDRINGWRFDDAASILYPQWEAVDLRADAAQLEVPIYLFRDEQERAGNRELADEWLGIIDAPVEQVFAYDIDDPFPVSDPLFVRYDEVERILVETILPETYPAP